jgi:hypothetical protein
MSQYTNTGYPRFSPHSTVGRTMLPRWQRWARLWRRIESRIESMGGSIAFKEGDNMQGRY